MNDFLGSLPKDLYARYYLSTQTNGRYAPDRKQVYWDASAHKQFNSIDFSNELLYPVCTVARYLLCHHGKFMNSQYEGLNASTDAIIRVAVAEVAQHLFQFFEKRSLFPAKALGQPCSLTNPAH
jgi:hypothetical protein